MLDGCQLLISCCRSPDRLVGSGNGVIAAGDRAGVVENDLGQLFADGQDDAVVLVEVADLHRPAVDIARIAPAGVDADGDAVAPPGAAGQHLRGARRLDADKFMGVGQDSLLGLQDYDLLVGRNVFEKPALGSLGPLPMLDGFERPLEIPLDLFFRKRIVKIGRQVVFGLVIPLAQGHVEAGPVDLPGMKGLADDPAALNRLQDLSVAVDAVWRQRLG